MGKNGNHKADPSKRPKRPAAASARHTKYALCRLEDVGLARQARFEPVLCPVLSHVELQDAPLLVSLPIVDANALLINALEKLREIAANRRPTAAAFFAADPFLHAPSLFDLLRRSRITHLFNFPSVQVFDGSFADNLNRVGCGKALEFSRMSAACHAGFQVIALMRDRNELPPNMGIKGCALLPLPNELASKNRTSLVMTGKAATHENQRPATGVIKNFRVELFGRR